MGRADQAMPEGTRSCVAGRGRGTYVSFVRWRGGANEHTIAFDSGETATIRLRVGGCSGVFEPPRKNASSWSTVT